VGVKAVDAVGHLSSKSRRSRMRGGAGGQEGSQQTTTEYEAHGMRAICQEIDAEVELSVAACTAWKALCNPPDVVVAGDDLRKKTS
jgi:hypothetical protein